MLPAGTTRKRRCWGSGLLFCIRRDRERLEPVCLALPALARDPLLGRRTERREDVLGRVGKQLPHYGGMNITSKKALYLLGLLLAMAQLGEIVYHHCRSQCFVFAFALAER